MSIKGGGDMSIDLHLHASTILLFQKYVKTYRVYLIGLCNETYDPSKRFE